MAKRKKQQRKDRARLLCQRCAEPTNWHHLRFTEAYRDVGHDVEEVAGSFCPGCAIQLADAGWDVVRHAPGWAHHH